MAESSFSQGIAGTRRFQVLIRNDSRKGGKAAVGAGTLPVGVQGRSALPAGGNRRGAKQLQ